MTNDTTPATIGADAALAKLRHLYRNLIEGGVRDTAQAKRIAEGLLAPAIAVLERAALASAAQPASAPAAVAEQEPVVHDEELLEQMYWEFDGQRSRTGEERLAFKGKMRSYASEFRRRSDGEMTFAQSVSDDMMNLADRLGSEYDDVDPRAWKHLLVYAPKGSPAAPAAQGDALTDTYVQQVPDKCDRIVWRGRYYHLPIDAAEHSYTEPSPMAKVAAALRQKAEQEDAAYQARRSDQGLMESEWGPMEDAPPHEDPPMHVAVVEGDDTVRTLQWNRDVAAFAYPAGTLLYAARSQAKKGGV